MSSEIDRHEMQECISAISNLFSSIYVLPDVGMQVVDSLTDLQSTDQLIGLNRDAFCTVITETMQSVSGDRHLQLSYDPEFYEMLVEKLQQPQTERDSNPLYLHYNCNIPKVERMAGNIGYLKIDGFVGLNPGKTVLDPALLFLQNCDAIIIDLRDNEGGRPELVHYLISHFIRDQNVQLTSLYDAEEDKLHTYQTTSELVTEQLLDVPLYLLTSSTTFSAGEDLTYTLKALNRAKLIGEQTGGGGHAGGFKTLQYGYYIWISTKRAINPITNSNWEGTGIVPDINVDAEDALQIAHQLALEAVLDQSRDPHEVTQALSEYQ